MVLYKLYEALYCFLSKTKSFDNAILELVGLAIMVYEPLYHALQLC